MISILTVSKREGYHIAADIDAIDGTGTSGVVPEIVVVMLGITGLRAVFYPGFCRLSFRESQSQEME